MAPIDRFLQTYRVPVIVGTVAVAVLGSPLLYFLTFDFDPIHLRSPATESISTLLDLGADSRSVSIRLTSLCRRLMTPMRLLHGSKVAASVEYNDAAKLCAAGSGEKACARFRSLDERLGPVLQRPATSKPPTDAENVAALNGIADQLDKIAGDAKGPGADAAKRLAAASRKLAQADVPLRERRTDGFYRPAQDRLRQFAELSPKRSWSRLIICRKSQAPVGHAGRTRTRRGRAERQYK